MHFKGRFLAKIETTKVLMKFRSFVLSFDRLIVRSIVRQSEQKSLLMFRPVLVRVLEISTLLMSQLLRDT